MPGLYDLGGGGGGLYAPVTAPVQNPQKPSGGLFGLGFGPDINLGLVGLAKMPFQAIGGLANLAANAPGSQAGNQAWSTAGHALGSSMLGTVESIPGLQIPLRHTGLGQSFTNVLTGGSDALKPRPIWEQIQQGQGLLPAVVQNVGNVALAGGLVSKAASLGMGLAGGEAAVGEGLAGEPNLASRLSQVHDVAEQVAHPYQTLGRRVISPFARAGAAARESAAGIAPEVAARMAEPETFTQPRLFEPEAPGRAAEALNRAGYESQIPRFGEQAARADFAEAARRAAAPVEQPTLPGEFPAPVERPLTAAETLANVRKTGEPGYPGAAEAGAVGNAPVGPRQLAFEARRNAPIPENIQNLVNQLPEFAQQRLANIEGRISKYELGRVVREQTLLADAAVKKAMGSPALQQMYEVTRAHIMTDPDTGLPRTLPDGSPVTPDIADQMFGDAVRQRATGIEGVMQQLSAAPGAAERAAYGINGRYSLPPEWRTPDLDAAITAGATTTANLARQQMDVLTGGRLGEQGLERVGAEEPLMTLGEQKLLKDAKARLADADAAAQRIAESRARLAKSGAELADREARQVRAEDALRVNQEARTAFDPASAPPLFTSPQWREVLAKFTHGLTGPDDGATLNPMKGRVLEPAAFGGQDTGWAVGIKELQVPGFDGTNGRVPLAEWNRVVNTTTGATRGDQIIGQVTLDYQKTLANGDMNLGLWVDPEGNVSVDISQTTQNGVPISRQQARSLGSFRGQDSVFDFEGGHSVPSNADPAVASHFLDYHQGRDLTSKAYEALVQRESTAAAAEGRKPRITMEQIDAVMDVQDANAVRMAQARPDLFSRADDVYKAVKTTLGKDPNRLPGNALLDSVLPKGGLGRTWWDAAAARFPHAQELAAWYDRSHAAIEGEFGGGQTITLLDGTTRPLIDVAYDMIALGSVQATPLEDMANAVKALTNTRRTIKAMDQGIVDARGLLKEFQEQGVTGPTFRRLAGDVSPEALASTRAQLGEDVSINKGPGKKLYESEVARLIAADPTVVGKMHMYGDAYRRMLPSLMGRDMNTWDPEYLANTLPELMGNKGKKLDLNKAMISATDRATASGQTLDEYIASRGQARANALLAEKSPSAPTAFTPEDIRRLGESEILKEHYAGEALAKVRSFRENLASPATSDAVTLDMWMRRLFDDPATVTSGGGYGKWADELRATAAQLRSEGVTVEGAPIRAHHVQALLWAYSMDEWNRLAALAEEHGVALPGKLDKVLARGEEILREHGVEPNQPRSPNQPLPAAQDFMHALDHPKVRAMLNDEAHAQGYDSVGKMFLDGFKDELASHKIYEGQVLHETDPAGTIKGATWAQESGKMMVRYFQTADARTIIHENAHVMRAMLPPEELTAMEGAYGVRPGGAWSVPQEEAFAHDWTDLASGRTANATAAVPAIRRLQLAVSAAWQLLKEKLPGGHRVTQATADLFNDWFDPTKIQAAGTVKEDILQRNLGRTEARAAAGDAKAVAQQARVESSRATLEAAKGTLAQKLQSLGQDEARLVVGNREAAMKALAKVAASQDNPSLARTPTELQPIWHAYTSMADHAAKTGDLALAQQLVDMGTGLSDVLEAARANGFDPQYIPKMSPAQVQRITMQGMKLVRELAPGEQVEAGARSARSYAHPELQDRSIAGLAAGYIDAVHEMHVNHITEYVEKNFAREIPRPADGGAPVIPAGWKPWSDTKQMIMTGAKTPAGVEVGTGSMLMIPEELDRTLRNFGKSYDHPAFNAIKKITSPWRALTLPLSPAWYTHVIIGHTIMSLVGGARLGDWAGAWQAWREGQVEGQLASHFTPETIGATRGAAVQDIFSGEAGQTGMPLRLRETVRAASGAQGKLEAVTGRLSRPAQIVDELGRVAVYLSGKRAGLSDVEALSKVHSALVDYGDLSPFERSFVRSVVPFYAFQKGILKVAARYAYDTPAIMGITAALGTLNEELQKDRYGTTLPEAYADVVKVPFLGDVNVAPFSSFADSLKLLTPAGIGGAANPFIKFAAGQAFGAPETLKGTQYQVTPTGGLTTVPRPNQLANVLGTTGGFQLPGRVAGLVTGASGVAGANQILGGGGYTDPRLATAAASQVRNANKAQGMTAGQILQLVQQSGLPLTAAQTKSVQGAATRATKAAASASSRRARGLPAVPKTRARSLAAAHAKTAHRARSLHVARIKIPRAPRHR